MRVIWRVNETGILGGDESKLGRGLLTRLVFTARICGYGEKDHWGFDDICLLQHKTH